jgi:ABC-2 type transport system permease protein
MRLRVPPTVRLVAWREIAERSRRPAFRIGLAVQLLLVVGFVALTRIGTGTPDAKVGTVGTPAAAVARLAEAGAGKALHVHPRAVPDAAAARGAIDRGELDAALVPAAGALRVEVAPDAPDALVPLLQAAARQVVAAAALARAHADSATRRAVLDPAPLAVATARTPRTTSGKGLAYISSFLLYLTFVVYGYVIAGGVVEEKSSRVIEVLLGAVSPRELLAGKVAGIGALSLGGFAATLVAGVAAALVLGVDLPSTTGAALALVAVCFLGGFVLYALLFAAAGALVSRQEDLQAVSSPLTGVLVAGFLVSNWTLSAPTSPLAVIASLFPLTAPLVLPGRVALTSVPWWQVALALAGLALASTLVLRVAAGVYETSVLQLGARIPLREALRRARA